MRKIRLQKRANVPTGRRVLNSILFVALALVFCGVFLAIVGFNPFEVYAKMWKAIFSVRGLQRSIVAGLPPDVYRSGSGLWLPDEPE